MLSSHCQKSCTLSLRCVVIRRRKKNMLKGYDARPKWPEYHPQLREQETESLKTPKNAMHKSSNISHVCSADLSHLPALWHRIAKCQGEVMVKMHLTESTLPFLAPSISSWRWHHHCSLPIASNVAPSTSTADSFDWNCPLANTSSRT
jgi:hypothetical protein